MKRRIYLSLALASCITVTTSTFADPVSDNQTIRAYFTEKFPDIALLLPTAKTMQVVLIMAGLA